MPSAGVVHYDRSPVPVVLPGLALAWASWLVQVGAAMAAAISAEITTTRSISCGMAHGTRKWHEKVACAMQKL